jgi:hypothetical protein
MTQRTFTPEEETELRAAYAALPKGPWFGMSEDDKRAAGTAWDHFRYPFKRPETEQAYEKLLAECKANDPFGKYFEPWPNYYYRPPLTEEELSVARAEAAKFRAECEALGIKLKN